MSLPRRAFGPQPAGRLAGTMLRVLAAELSDPARFTRARGYARDGAVIDIDISPGTVRADVRGSRFEPYSAELHVRPASRHELEAVVPGTATGTEMLVPERDELLTWCSCPDETRVCKHAIAALLVLADEVTIEPDVLVRWRSGSAASAPSRTERVVRSDPLAGLLHARGELPAVPAVPILDAVPLPHHQHELADVIASALAALRR